MKCPHCSKDIRDDLVVSEAAKIHGKRAGRRDGGGNRCQVHGIYMKNGVCKRCEITKSLWSGSPSAPSSDRS